MRVIRPATGIAWLAALPIVVVAASGASAQKPTPPPVAKAVPCAGAEAEPPPTDTLITDAGGAAVPVPPPGTGISQSGLEDDASGSQELTLNRSADGSLIVESCGAEGDGSDAGTDDAAKLAPDPCNAEAHDRSGWKWTQAFHWEFNGDSTPRELDANDAEEGLKDGRLSIVRSRNNCGLSDNVSVRQSYDGWSGRATQVNSNASCDPFGQRDDHSVVVFGDQPSGRLATTCTYFFIDSGLDTAVESDVTFNKQQYQWARNGGGGGCTNEWSVRGVSTHESGHTFGLDHVAEQDQGRQTMSPKIDGRCQESEYTLGKGDVLGLRSIY